MTRITDFANLARLLRIMEQLRHPEDGCPWDRKQTFSSIVPHTIEEAYEVADAIETGTPDEIKDELGDLLFQVVFYAQLAKEQQSFDFEDIAEAISNKLVRRHPHVFSDAVIEDEHSLQQNWERIKQQERTGNRKKADDSVLAHVPHAIAPLIRAEKLQKQCAKVGFDWSEPAPVVEKIREEIDEVVAEMDVPAPDSQRLEEEIGDLLFAVVNLARHLNINSETALRKANRKFERRCRGVESAMQEDGHQLSEASVELMEAYWQKVKTNTNPSN